MGQRGGMGEVGWRRVTGGVEGWDGGVGRVGRRGGAEWGEGVGWEGGADGWGRGVGR